MANRIQKTTNQMTKVRISKTGRKILNDNKLSSELVATINKNAQALHFGEQIKFGGKYIVSRTTTKKV